MYTIHDLVYLLLLRLLGITLVNFHLSLFEHLFQLDLCEVLLFRYSNTNTNMRLEISRGQRKLEQT